MFQCVLEKCFGIETWLIWGLCFSGTLHIVDWWLLQKFQASYLSHFQGSSSVRKISDWLLKTAPTACPEMSVTNYQRCLTSSRAKVSIWYLALIELDKKRPNGEIWDMAYRIYDYQISFYSVCGLLLTLEKLVLLTTFCKRWIRILG